MNVEASLNPTLREKVMGTSSHNFGAYTTVGDDELSQLCSRSSSSLYVFSLIVFLVFFQFLCISFSTTSVIFWNCTFVTPINKPDFFYYYTMNELKNFMSLLFLRLGCEARGVRGVKPTVQGVWSPNLFIFLNLNSHFLVLLCKTLVFFSIAWRWLRSIMYYINFGIKAWVPIPFKLSSPFLPNPRTKSNPKSVL